MKSKKLFLKFISFFLLIPCISCCFITIAHAETALPDTSMAENIYLYNTNTDQIIYSKNTDTKIFPGSAVKMMTGLIACEMLSERLDESITITEEMIKISEGASIKLSAGMTVTFENLLYGVLCGGGNDASLALAIVCAGSVEGFVKAMNAQAIEWGLKSTYFTNPTGLDDKNMYSTLADIIKIAKIAYQNELYMQISSTPSYVFTPLNTEQQIKFFNRNCLISTFYGYGYQNQRASGMISGYTDLGGYCAITYAEKNDMGYICAVMNAKEDDKNIYSYKIVNDLLSYAFGNYSYLQIAKKGRYICDIEPMFTMPQSGSDTASVSCVIDTDIYALAPNDIDPDTDLEYRYYLHYDELHAPIASGTVIGGVDIIYNGEIIGNALLVTESDVPASELLLFLDRLRTFFSGRFFCFSIIYFSIGFALYYYFAVLKYRRKKAKNISYKYFY